ncbi:MAG: glycosyltransferase [Gaiellaceae bacterium]
MDGSSSLTQGPLPALEQNLREMERSRERYWLRYPGTSPTKLRWRALTVRHAFHVLPGESILELGAGSGLWTAHLSAVLRGQSPITAAVFTNDLADQAEAKRLPNVTVKRLDDLAKLEPASFDYVVGTAILCHDEYGQNLRALHSLLKPGGGLLFFEANYWNPQVLAKNVVPGLGRRAGQARCEIGMRRFRLLQETSRAGFTQIEVIPYDIVHPRIPRRFVPAVQSLAYLFEHTPAARELCGTLYLWAKKPGDERARRPRVDLAARAELHGSTSVVVPCRNESTTIADLVSQLLEHYRAYLHEIVVVDDCSTDDTADVVRALARREPCVKLIARTGEPGVGRALRDGYAAASGRYVLSMDADFALIVPELRDLFEAVADGREGALGSRFSQDSILVNYPFAKILANRGFHLLVKLLAPVSVRDASNNLKLLPDTVYKQLRIEEDGFAANAEIGLQPLLAGHDIAEVPISWINRTAGMGSSSFQVARAGPGYARVLRRIIARRLREDHRW